MRTWRHGRAFCRAAASKSSAPASSSASPSSRPSLSHEDQLAYAALWAARGDAVAAPRNIDDALTVLRDRTGRRFYNPRDYADAVATVEAAQRVVSAAHHPLSVDFVAYRTPFSLLSADDWSLRERHDDLFQFARNALAFRRAHRVLRAESFYSDADIRWLGPNGARPAWDEPGAKSLGCVVRNGQRDLCLLFNASTGALCFALPAGPWVCAMDTSRPSQAAPHAVSGYYDLAPRCSAILTGSR